MPALATLIPQLGSYGPLGIALIGVIVFATIIFTFREKKSEQDEKSKQFRLDEMKYMSLTTSEARKVAQSSDERALRYQDALRFRDDLLHKERHARYGDWTLFGMHCVKHKIAPIQMPDLLPIPPLSEAEETI